MNDRQMRTSRRSVYAIHTLNALGHEGQVSLLDGRFTVWDAADGETVSEAQEASYEPDLNLDVVATREFVADTVDEDGAAISILDMRSPEEYWGVDERGDLDRFGHVAGLSSDETTVAYCQTAIRASVGWFVLDQLGWDDVRNYEGSWADWGRSRRKTATTTTPPARTPERSSTPSPDCRSYLPIRSVNVGMSTREETWLGLPQRAKPLVQAGVLLGLGFGGFFDGIVLHQILQWHHMVSARVAPTTIGTLRANVLADGLFHAATYVFTVLGIALLWRAWKRPSVPKSGRSLFGSTILGWGIFNVVEGIVNHHLLDLHHVWPAGPGPVLLWDIAFLVWGVLFIVGGYAAVRRDDTFKDFEGIA